MDKDAKDRRKAPLQTPTDLGSNASRDITAALNTLLADMFALYMKTKNFHWHVSGPHFRDYHLMFDEQADQIFATTDDIAERVRKVGGLTLHSIGEIARLQRIPDNDADYVDPLDMLAELRSDNQAVITALREAHALCDDENDVATASLIEVGSTRPSGACGSCMRPPAAALRGIDRPRPTRLAVRANTGVL